MTITVTNIVAGPYIAMGEEQTLPFAFKVFTPSEVEVVVGADRTPISLALYSVDINTAADGQVMEGGSILLSAGAVASGEIIRVVAKPEATQEMVFSDTGSRLRNINEGLDRAALRALRAQYDGALEGAGQELINAATEAGAEAGQQAAEAAVAGDERISETYSANYLRRQSVVRLRSDQICAMDGSDQAAVLNAYLLDNPDVREIVLDPKEGEVLGLSAGVLNWRSDLRMIGQGDRPTLKQLSDGNMITLPGSAAMLRNVWFDNLNIDQAAVSNASAAANTSWAFFLDTDADLNKFADRVEFLRMSGNWSAGFLRDGHSGASAYNELVLDIRMTAARARQVDVRDAQAFVEVLQFVADYSGWLTYAPISAAARLANLNDTAFYVEGPTGYAVGGLNVSGLFEVSGAYGESVDVDGSTVDYAALGGAPNQHAFRCNNVTDVTIDTRLGSDSTGGDGVIFENCAEVRGKVWTRLARGHGLSLIRTEKTTLDVHGFGSGHIAAAPTTSDFVRIEDCRDVSLPSLDGWRVKGYGLAVSLNAGAVDRSGAALNASRVAIGNVKLLGQDGAGASTRSGVAVDCLGAGKNVNLTIAGGAVDNFDYGEAFNAVAGATITTTEQLDVVNSSTAPLLVTGAGTVTRRAWGSNQDTPVRNALLPATDDALDLGSTAKRFRATYSVKARFGAAGSPLAAVHISHANNTVISPAGAAPNTGVGLFMGDVSSNYGFLGGVLASTGATWFQSQSLTSAAYYPMHLQPSGGAVTVGSGLTDTGDGTINVKSGHYTNGQKVVGARGAALPADATDLATALALVNAIKARLKVTGGHGLVAD